VCPLHRRRRLLLLGIEEIGRVVARVEAEEMIIEGAIVEGVVGHAAKDVDLEVKVAHVRGGDIVIDLGRGAPVADRLGGDVVAGEVGRIVVPGGIGLRLAEIGTDIVTKIHHLRMIKVGRYRWRRILKTIMALEMIAGLENIAGEIDLVPGREVVEVEGGEIRATVARGAGAAQGVWTERRKRMVVRLRKANLTTQKKETILRQATKTAMIDQDAMIVETIVMTLTVIIITMIKETAATWMSVI
jgi:hypothetical protein